MYYVRTVRSDRLLGRSVHADLALLIQQVWEYHNGRPAYVKRVPC